MITDNILYLAVKSSLRMEIISLMRKYAIPLDSKPACDFLEIVEKISFKELKDETPNL